ncbi:MAG: hypothetical protein JXR72_04620 [Proteobacteria bacterium]|nr:hypothetical protein [Pseudomonadota bacterium]
MKKFGGSLLVVLLAMGLMVAFSGCGDDDDDGLPKSDSAYAGSNEAAYIGTEDGGILDFDDEIIPEVLGFLEHDPPFGPWIFYSAEGSDSEEYSYSGEGSGGGLFEVTYNSTSEGNESDYSWNQIFQVAFSDYLDSGDVPPYVLKGDGTLYWKNEESGIFTEYESPEVGSLADGFGYELPELKKNYVNYGDLSYIDDEGPDFTHSYAGWMSATHTRDWEAGLCDSIMGADFSYSWATTTEAAYQGLLDTEGQMAYDGSDTKIQINGRYCAEGESDSMIYGCVNFDIDVVFEDQMICLIEEDYDSKRQISLWPVWYYDQPDSGTVKVDNKESEADTLYSTAMYDYGDTDGPGRIKYLLDAESDGSYEYSTYFEYGD